ncbi:MAG: class I adenylate-forming enzyme family protein [Steroidobacteraceae bacterium]
MSLAALVDNAAKENPDGFAAASGDSRSTWREFSDRVARLAGGLRELNLLPGARVAVLAGLSQTNAELICALSRAGLVAVPINIRLNGRDIEHIIRDADVEALAFEQSFQEHALAVTAKMQIRNVISLSNTEHDRFIDYRQLLCSKPANCYVWSPEQLAAILYTGGTTGRPKGVMLSAQCVATHAAVIRREMGYSRDTVLIHTMPVFHIAGYSQFAGLVQGGGSLVFRPDAGPAATYQEIRAHGVNAFCCVPTTIAALLCSPIRDDALLTQIKIVGYGGSPISDLLLGQAITAMPNAKLRQIYGLTETGPITILPPQSHTLEGCGAGKLQSAGLPLPHVTIRIVDDRGVEQPPGRPGEIVVAGDGLTPGYWRNPVMTEELFRDDWLHTGDVGVKDEDGFITVVDRYKDMIITGGENVFSTEVENAIATHPSVEACAVIGLPHPVWGETVHAIVVCRRDQNVTPEEIIGFCRSRIARFKCPKSAEIRREPLPLSGVGKVLKNVLRTEAIAGRKIA